MNSQDNLNNLSQETINKLNNLGNHVVGSLFDIATPQALVCFMITQQ